MSLLPRHDGHDHGSSPDMVMDTGSGVYNNYTLQKNLWVVFGSVIAFATLVNVLDHILLYQRLRCKSAKPHSIFWKVWATATALGREVSGASFTPCSIAGFQFRWPTLGPILSVVVYIITIVVFYFIGTEPSNSWNWEDVAVRIGCINQAQLPLLFLLAGKKTVLGYLTGLTYERINRLHRWVARILWVGITMHMGFFFRSWIRWDFVTTKLAEDKMTQTGFAGWCILTAIFFLSFAPMRRLNYELFVASHIVLFAGFIGVVMIHVMTGTEYIWACVGIFLLDRLLRFLVVASCNIGLLRGRKQFWANHATMEALSGGLTRITIENPGFTWSPGQHVFLSCHGIVPFQSHPFTVASLSSDGKAQFLVQSKTGATKSLHQWASSNKNERKVVSVEGPYGHLRPLHQFHSIVLMAGSTGAAFTVPLLRDIVHRWSQGQATVTRSIRFVWAIKSKSQMDSFSSQLELASDTVSVLRKEGLDVELSSSIYVTCSGLEDCSTSLTSTQEVVSKDKSTATTTTEITNQSKSCCCRSTIENEGEATTCCCKDFDSAKQDLPLQAVSEPRLKVLGGRPSCRSIIRKVLEDAEGEAAVIVCGPRELRDHVRQCVIGLSDERAVHKGTGAQGIYLHVEGFGY